MPVVSRRDSATTTAISAPVAGSMREKATHWPSRTPSTRETTRSTSCG